MLASTINIQIPYIRESALYMVCCGLAVDGNTFWVSVRFLCHYITLRFFPLHANNISFIIIANIRSHIKHYASLLANLYHCHTLATFFFCLLTLVCLSALVNIFVDVSAIWSIWTIIIIRLLSQALVLANLSMTL